jgi:hypothetical protein
MREIEDFKYLVRFPLQKQIAATLIFDVTYFMLKKKGVLVSLKAWAGDVEPYDSLEEVWVHIRGVPPKWSIRSVFRQISSSLGEMLEVDWNSLFTSFFSMVRVKIACKDHAKIPSKILFEMRNHLYVIHFRVEAEGGGLGENLDDGVNYLDAGDGQDKGVEEIDHDLVEEEKGTPIEGDKTSNNGNLGTRCDVPSLNNDG